MENSRLDEITGLPMVPSQPMWIVVCNGLAHSQHKSKAAALAWIHWHMRGYHRENAKVILI